LVIQNKALCPSNPEKIIMHPGKIVFRSILVTYFGAKFVICFGLIK